MNITVSVTHDDIAKGVAADCHLCPVARAVIRALPGVPELSVGSMWLYRDGAPLRGQQMCSLPLAAVDWIEEFDGHNPVEPFEFVLDVPADLVPAGGEH
jgi:hypothetical protein